MFTFPGSMGRFKKGRKYLKPLPEGFTHEFVDCATGLTTVARFDNESLPTHNYLWIHDGSSYVKAYYVGISVGAATSPVPCVIYMPTSPANCAAVDVTAFSDDFGESSMDACKWVEVSGGTYSTTIASNTVSLSISNGNDYLLWKNEVAAVFGTGDFDFAIDISSVTVPTDSTAGWQMGLRCTIGGSSHEVQFMDYQSGGPGRGIITRVGASYVLEETVSSGGISNREFRIARVGSTVTFYVDGSSVRTVTNSGAVTVVDFGLYNPGAVNETNAADFSNFVVS